MDEPTMTSAAGSSAPEWSMMTLDQAMTEFAKRIPSPPVQRLRVTRRVYDLMAAHCQLVAVQANEQAHPDDVISLVFRGLPVVVSLHDNHQPGYEFDYRVAPPGCEFPHDGWHWMHARAGKAP